MPTIRIKTYVEADFSVYCGTCGSGLCGNTTVDNKHSSITVDACPICILIKDEEIQRLVDEIDELKYNPSKI
jgi:transcription elongation factor Elf1